VKFSFIRDENQQPVGILGVTRDITERKQANLKLEKQNKELAFQNEEKEKRAAELVIANKELVFQNEEKEKRAAELVIANKELVFQNEEKEKRAAELVIANKELEQEITAHKRAEVKLQQTLESLSKAFTTIVQVMVSAVEMRDPYTAGHQLRSANLACAIATEMGLPNDEIEGLRMAGSIHDIGKLSIPAEILSKPTKLTNIEFSLIKEHPQIGYEMMKDVESPWPLAQIVYQHHERMNGTGYPRNLKGDEIIMEARIMAVADVIEAMASHRPYRAALGIDAALAEIEKNKGTHYDNTVADACLRLFRERGYQLS
jgi:HD-GYP domain-containing protein (c-di-GMP phosphodiesterase class II)